MIKIRKVNESTWYLNEIKKIFLHGNFKEENIDKEFKKKTEDIDIELKNLGLSLNDFSGYKGRSLFEELIIASYEDLKKIFEKLPQCKEGLFWNSLKDNKGKEKKEYIGVWSEIYKSYDKLITKKLNNRIVQEFNVKSCPYCNENFILNRGNKTMAQLDHFYPKSDFPIFAICLYNLIPCCYSCNHIKDNNLMGVSPHDQNFDFENLKISYRPLSIDWLNDRNQLEISFKYSKNESGKLIKKNIDTLEISESYKFHNDYVQELIKKAEIYNKEKILELKTTFPNLFASEEEIFRIAFGNYIEDNDLLKRPLAKLTKDILEELLIV